MSSLLPPEHSTTARSVFREFRSRARTAMQRTALPPTSPETEARRSDKLGEAIAVDLIADALDRADREARESERKKMADHLRDLAPTMRCHHDYLAVMALAEDIG